MQNISGFDFFPLTFDENGKLTSNADLDDLKKRAAHASDVIFISHGFRNDVHDATTLYTNFLSSFRNQFQRPECQALGKCDFAVAGVYWPSKSLPESFASLEGSTQSLDDDAPLIAALTQKLNELKDFEPLAKQQIEAAIQLLPQVKEDGAAQNSFTDLLLAAIKEPAPDPTEGFEAVRNQEGATLLEKLSAPVILPSAAGELDADADLGSVLSVDDSDQGSVQSVGSTLNSILGGADRFINLTTWWMMKNRCGVVGATGVAQAVRDLAASQPSLKIHLVGHSLGGRLMAACAKSLAQDPLYQPASLTLLEAAFSHFGFSADNGKGTAGFFRDVIAKKVVKGPLVATFSAQDTVVGTTYSLASRVAGDNVKAIGDANDPFGGIGRNGAIKTTESSSNPLKKAGAPDGPYNFDLGIVNCLDGSGGLIKDHGDVTNADVTYLFACALVATQAGATATSGAGP